MTPNTGPSDGSRMAISAFSPMWLNAWPRPTVVTVLPSPIGVGVIPVTRMSLPSSPSAVMRSMASRLTLALCSPYSSRSPRSSP